MKKHLKKITACSAVLAVLAGCSATSAPVAPVEIVTKNAAFNSRIVGHKYTEFRTFASGPSGGKFEVQGADCIAESREFKAEFTSPAFVQLPVLNSRPSRLAITCDNGEVAGRAVYPPQPVSQNFFDDENWRYADGFIQVNLNEGSSGQY